MGIEFAITKKIIDKHNGLIRAENQEDLDSVFTLTLPTKAGESLTPLYGNNEDFVGR